MIYERIDLKLDYSKIDAPDTGYVAKMDLYVPNESREASAYTPKRPTVIVLPGGGYGWTSRREADPIALNFVAKGMNACVINYSVVPSTFPSALLEVLSAIKFLRENAEKYFVNKDKIFVCGFSAGGHLAASAGTLWNKKEAVKYFGDVEGLRPDGLVLGYPVITNDDKKSHLGSFDALLGDKKGDKEMLEYLCLDKQVSADTPPAFIWSTYEDDGVPCENSIRFALALREQRIPFELHIYEKGEHGAATGDRVTNFRPLRLKNWLEDAAAWIYDERSQK
ncbi:MAG: alpha/beta hydrolase [Clostridia bacterium]|nr:alpha/beta hydrolase [Clostridia bacterium]